MVASLAIEQGREVHIILITRAIVPWHSLLSDIICALRNSGQDHELMLNIHRHDHSSSDMSFEQCKLNPQSANLCTTDTTPDKAQKYLSLKSHLMPPVSNMHCKSFFLHIDDSLQLVVFSFWIDILQCEEFQSNLSHNFYGSKATVVVVQHCITLVGMLFSRVLYTILEMILKWNLVINFEAQTSSIRAIAPQLCGGEDVFTLYW